MQRRTGIGIVVLGLLSGLGGPAAAQSLAERVARAPDGAVRFRYPARPGVCGDGESIIVRAPGDEEKGSVRVVHGVHRGGHGWGEACESGPVRVELRSRGGEVGEVRIRVGSDFPGRATDLGEATAREAADYLLDLAARAPEDAGREAVTAASLARVEQPLHPRLLRLAADDRVPEETRRQAVFWAGSEGAPLPELQRLYAAAPERVREQVIFAYSQREEPEAVRELLRIARSPEEPRETRKQAVFWLGQAAGRSVTRDLGEMADDASLDLAVREHAIFALSQREDGVPSLIRIAREGDDPRLRRKAIFWLGQSGDPRAVALFEEILLGVR